MFSNSHLQIELRPYQREAVDALREHLAGPERGNPLVVLPPGTGKSLLCAELIRSTRTTNPSARCIVLAHSQELVMQNHDEFARLWPEGAGSAGIYSAGSGQRDTNSMVLFGTIQSLYQRFEELIPPPAPDLILIDEVDE